jgi:glutamyl-Q tRNA(Asp) synthetase
VEDGLGGIERPISASDRSADTLGRADGWRGVSPPVLTRFAPAPTGHLHLGHVVNAIYVWGLGRAHGGRVLLRIEDHDRQRARPEYEAALLDDLDWLGFANVYATDDFRRGRCEGRQSDRQEVYRFALQPLVERGLVYACSCTRRQLDAPVYPGTCRERGLPLAEGVGWRVRVDPGEVVFTDGRLGLQRQEPATQCGDVLVRDRVGNWTYQWAVTVDDLLQGITDVIRGEDLLASTGRQIYLARLLGRSTPPTFLHHPLVMKSPTQKLSKSDRDTGIRELRAAGWTAPQVIGHASALVGLQGEPRAVHASEVPRLFEGLA